MERYSLEQAQDEASKMQEIMASEEIRTYGKAQRMVEERRLDTEVGENNGKSQNKSVELEKEELQNTQDEKLAISEKIAARKKEDEEKIAALRENIMNTGNKEGQKQEYLTPSSSIKRLEDGFTGLTSAFRAREQENLSPLVDGGFASRLQSSVVNLDEVARQKNLNTKLLGEILSDIRVVVSRFGDVPRGGTLRESPESLRRIRSGLDATVDALVNLHRNLPEAADIEEVKSSIRNLGKKIEKIREFIGNRWNMLEKYNRR